MMNTLDLKGDVLCAHAVLYALHIFDRRGSVEIRGLRGSKPLTFTRREDLELLQKSDALWRAPGNIRWANFHAD